MSYAPGIPVARRASPMILPDLVAPFTTGTTVANSGVTANQAYYLPFTIHYATAITALSFYNISGTNNHDLGIYDSAGTRLASRGTTATSVATLTTWTLGTPQPIVADTLYFVAFASAGANTLGVLSNTAGQVSQRLGVMIQSPAFVLPSTATFAAPGTVVVPLIAVTLAV